MHESFLMWAVCTIAWTFCECMCNASHMASFLCVVSVQSYRPFLCAVSGTLSNHLCMCAQSNRPFPTSCAICAVTWTFSVCSMCMVTWPFSVCDMYAIPWMFSVNSVCTLYWTLSNCISNMGTIAWTLVCSVCTGANSKHVCSVFTIKLFVVYTTTCGMCIKSHRP